jgi:hypothetical protein
MRWAGAAARNSSLGSHRRSESYASTGQLLIDGNRLNRYRGR